MAPNGARRTLGPIPKVCRICDRDHSVTSFPREAHVIPEFAGNKTLFSNYECDDCNQRFGRLESDLSELTLFSRILAGIPKKNSGLPAFKNAGGTLSIRSSGDTINIIGSDHDEQKLVVERSEGEVHYSLTTRPFRPLAVFKALTKIAYLLIPTEQLEPFHHLKAWLQEVDLQPGYQFGMYGHGCIISKITGYKPTIPMVALFGRTSDIVAPSCILLLVFGHFGFQAVVPCPNMENSMVMTEPFAFRVVPVEYFLSPKQKNDVSYEWIDLTRSDKISLTQSWVAKGQENTQHRAQP
jgi:hypothetical protein